MFKKENDDKRNSRIDTLLSDKLVEDRVSICSISSGVSAKLLAYFNGKEHMKLFFLCKEPEKYFLDVRIVRQIDFSYLDLSNANMSFVSDKLPNLSKINFERSRLKKKQIETFVNPENYHKVQSLKFYESEIIPEEKTSSCINLIADHFPNLIHVNLQHFYHKANEKQEAALCYLLSKCNKIQRLKLTENVDITNDILRCLGEHCQDLRILDLQDFWGTSKDLEYLLKRCKKLEILELFMQDQYVGNGNEFEVDDVLLKLLMNNCPNFRSFANWGDSLRWRVSPDVLKQFLVQCSDFKEDLGFFIGATSQTLCVLVDYHRTYIHLTESKIYHLPSDDKLNNLTSLHLTDCIGTVESFNDVLLELSKVLKNSNGKLMRLSLEKNKINDDGCIILRDGISNENCKLESLSVANNNISSYGKILLIDTLNNPESTLLDLQFYGQTPQTVNETYLTRGERFLPKFGWGEDDCQLLHSCKQKLIEQNSCWQSIKREVPEMERNIQVFISENENVDLNQFMALSHKERHGILEIISQYDRRNIVRKEIFQLQQKRQETNDEYRWMKERCLYEKNCFNRETYLAFWGLSKEDSLAAERKIETAVGILVRTYPDYAPRDSLFKESQAEKVREEKLKRPTRRKVTVRRGV